MPPQLPTVAVAEHLKINISRFKTYADMGQALDAYFVAKREYKTESFGQQQSTNSSGYYSMEVDYVGKGSKGKETARKEEPKEMARKAREE